MASFIPIKTVEELAGYIPQTGPLQMRNQSFSDIEDDVLYHIALGKKSHDLKDMFHDVKFVCFGGSPNRMRSFAEYMVKALNYKMPAGQDLCDIAHGMVWVCRPCLLSSMRIFKLLHHAECSDVTFFRLGTSGGLGLKPGTVIITEEAVDGLLRPYMEVATLGMMLQHPSRLSHEVAQELLNLADPNADFDTIIGKTMCTLDFYEGQARLDGFFCDYSKEDKMAFLRRVHNRGIKNIEMESLCFAAYCYRAGIKSAVVCVTLLDRMEGDQINVAHEVIEEWQQRPQRLVAAYIRKHLGIESNVSCNSI
ncbi:hypothetical protein C0Q70_02693 [Pomacea canaliculata]|uniref:Nucleoside phosphorylase domain-containing protein n=1 Tax=Pomacea canaliculata TaxID=400727 RepID=A0A2T7PQR5_POMCA|nr:hypothetical protein C0Q70_02693 [Pomacea canaliculata]